MGIVCRRAIALLLLASVSLGVLPLSLEMPLTRAGEKSACRFEPIDVCGAGDASLGMLVDTPVLLAEAVVVFASETELTAPASAQAAAPEGFTPGVYRPPRLSC